MNDLSADLAPPRTRAIKIAAAIVLAIVAVIVAAFFDATIAQHVRTSGSEDFFHDHGLLREALKSPGVYLFTFIVGLIILVIDRMRWRRFAFFMLASGASGVGIFIKWAVGRMRPYKIDPNVPRLAPFELHPFRGGIKEMLASHNLCFPSGHACLAFATATALGILWPRRRWAFFIGATCVAAERVAENAHWFSDAIAGAAIGIAMASLAGNLLNPWTRKPPRSRL